MQHNPCSNLLMSQSILHTKTAPLVSIAMCTYNGGAYIREQLDSIINQTYKHLEIVIVDDVSTDNTRQIINEYIQRDERIKFYQNEINLGFNKNFEKAVVLTTGEWISIADQDDIWHLEKIEHMLNNWNGKAEMLYCSSKKFKDGMAINFTKTTPYTRGLTGEKITELACRNCTEGHTIIIHKSLKEKIIPFKNVPYDWWIGMVASVNGGIQWIDKISVWRRIHENNSYEKMFVPKSSLAATWAAYLETFIQIKGMGENDKKFMEHCILLIRQKATAAKWRSFIFKNRNRFFYYKKGFSFFSKIKGSISLAQKLSSTG